MLSAGMSRPPAAIVSSGEGPALSAAAAAAHIDFEWIGLEQEPLVTMS